MLTNSLLLMMIIATNGLQALDLRFSPFLTMDNDTTKEFINYHITQVLDQLRIGRLTIGAKPRGTIVEKVTLDESNLIANGQYGKIITLFLKYILVGTMSLLFMNSPFL
jgi:hypothetical protein